MMTETEIQQALILLFAYQRSTMMSQNIEWFRFST